MSWVHCTLVKTTQMSIELHLFTVCVLLQFTFIFYSFILFKRKLLCRLYIEWPSHAKLMLHGTYIRFRDKLTQ